MLPEPYNGTTTLDDLLRKADEEKATIERTCKRSALFMSNLSRPATEGVYWSMAAAIIILAMAVGVVYSNNQKEYRAFEEYERDYKKRTAGRSPTEEESAEYKEMIKTHRKNAWNCLGKTSILLVFAVACNTMMVFSILTIQHCHHEVLLGLYWPLWTFLGLGSNIAMAGVLLSQCYGLSCQELPPYGTALGTPVLVVCSIGHFLYSWIPHKFGRGSKSQNVDLERAAASDIT